MSDTTYTTSTSRMLVCTFSIVRLLLASQLTRGVVASGQCYRTVQQSAAADGMIWTSHDYYKLEYGLVSCLYQDPTSHVLYGHVSSRSVQGRMNLRFVTNTVKCVVVIRTTSQLLQYQRISLPHGQLYSTAQCFHHATYIYTYMYIYITLHSSTTSSRGTLGPSRTCLPSWQFYYYDYFYKCKTCIMI